MTGMRSGLGSRWWWPGVSPLLLAGVWTVLLLAIAVGRVGRSLRTAELQRIRECALLAELAADAMADDVAAAGMPDCLERCIGGCQVRAERRAGGYRFLVARDGYQCEFAADMVPGAAPAVFAKACGLGRTECRAWRIGEGALLPQLDPHQLSTALSATASTMFRRDGAVALARLAAGTDGDDYVVDPRHVQFGLPAQTAVVEVPGHLWIEPAGGPWRPWLDRDVTVVVRGNLYCGASIEPLGPGRLTIAAVPPGGAVAFVDTDGNGRWTQGEPLVGGGVFRGPIEGGGSAYFGLTGAPGALECKAAVVVGGELHARGVVRIAGPVVAAGGITLLTAGSRLEPLGTVRFAVERERVPGFSTTGAPRLGLLRRCDPQGRAEVAEDLLYLAAPAR